MHRHIQTGHILDCIEAKSEHCQLSSLVFMGLYTCKLGLSIPKSRCRREDFPRTRRMRDSIKLRCRPRRAGYEQDSTGALHLDGFESLATNKKCRYPVGYLHFLAEDEGFEPPQTESESGVLPLHKSSICGTLVLYPISSKSQVVISNFLKGSRGYRLQIAYHPTPFIFDMSCTPSIL